MKKEFRKGRWTITFIKVRRGYFQRSFKIDKQKGSMVFLISVCIGHVSLYIRRGWYPTGRINTFKMNLF
jgi:hypothetical protein